MEIAIKILFVLAFLAIPCEARIITVDDNGPADFNTIQAAINDADAGDTVLVANGIYTGPGNRDILISTTPVTVRSENGPHNCIIDCENLCRAFYFDADDGNGSTLDGFTITNGNGGGYAAGDGGAILCENSNSPTITNCIITGNSAENIGGAILCRYHGSPTIINCIIKDNFAEGGGGAIYCGSNSSITISNCTITANQAFDDCGGIFCNESTLTINNSILWDNTKPIGPATIHLEQIYLLNDSNASLAYTDLQDGSNGVYVESGIVNWLQGNIDADPCFALSDDYHLLSTSPCINTGEPNYVPEPNETDVDGNPRIFGGRIDMGASEYNPNTSFIVLSPSSFSFYGPQAGPQPYPKSLFITNAGGGPLHWQIVKDCNWLDASPAASCVSTGQTDEVTLTIDQNSLSMGSYSCILTVTGPNAVNTPQAVDVDLHVGALLRVPDDFNTIQEAIDDACDFDTVLVALGTYTGDGNRDLDFLGKAITVRSENGPNNCIIDCNGSAVAPHRGFYFDSGEDSNSIVGGFTITNGYAESGGAIECSDGSPSIIDCNITGNSAEIDGGAIHCHYGRNGFGSPTVFDCIITANSADRWGGAINCDNWSLPTITYCTISNNSADDGGGIFCNSSRALINNCTFNTNVAFTGGAIKCFAESNATIADCTFTENSAVDDGGAISCFFGSHPSITNCTFTGNSVEYDGGGIYVSLDSNPAIVNCTFTDNSCEGNGAGISCDDNSNPTITSCTFNQNSADSVGGGLFIDSVSPSISSCSFTENTASSGAGISCGGSNSLINDCNFSGNTAGISSGRGGGIAIIGNSPTLKNCTFKNNSAEHGGGIYTGSSANPIVTGCTFTQNSASWGGGIRIFTGGSADINNCTFTANSASAGSAVFCEESTATIADCIITKNIFSFGGAIERAYDSNTTITRCTITGNTATYYGAAISGGAGPIKNCIITGNYSPGDGGGIFESQSPIINCTIAANYSRYSGGGTAYCDGPVTNSVIWNNFPDQISNWHEEVTYCNIQGGHIGLGNIDADPCFVEPGYWTDVNDPNIIVEPNDPNAVWVNGDYHLKSAGWRWDTTRQRWDWDDVTSRCIDAGNPGSPLGDEPLSIHEDPNNIWGRNLRINMGAFGGTAEASMPPYDWALLSDMTNDGISDFNDLQILSSLWLNNGESLYADFDRDGDIDFFDFALLADDWLLQTSWH